MHSALRTRITITAGLIIIALTGAAFFLSYEHLHDVAVMYGLGHDPKRAWLWPATLDLFVVAGELLMLVAALAKRRDYWAVGITTAGSVGSIALNVFGVGTGANTLDYVVAAVPPSAALLAFGVLMQQVHHALTADEADTREARSPLAALSGLMVKAPESHPDMAAFATGMTTWIPELADPVEEPQVDEANDVVTQISAATTKPSDAAIRAAMADIVTEGLAVSGATLAPYFGVSARTGRRYIDGLSELSA